MNEKIIKADSTRTYLSEVINEIPANVLFDKGKTGCGGTNLEIKTPRHSIIAVPNISLIDNKVQQHSNLMGVYGGVDSESIISYIKDESIPFKKVMVTYNSLERVIKAIHSSGLSVNGLPVNVYRDFFLLVDEYHILFNQYVLRNEPIVNLLKVVPIFRRATYMTATPLEREFLLEELKHIPVVKVNWEGLTEVTVKPIQYNNPIAYAASLVRQRLNGKMVGNLHIFLNSVTGINKLIKTSGISADKIKIVCAKKAENQNKLPQGYTISNDTLIPNIVNVYTSTAFEGIDIYDEEGRTVIVSDGRYAQSLIDISTLFIQICGRIRNSKYNQEVTHIYSGNNRYNKQLSYPEYIKSTEEQIKDDLSLIDAVNSQTKVNRDRLVSNLVSSSNIGNPYLRVGSKNELELDMNRVKLDRMNFKITRHIYKCKVNLLKEYKGNGLNAAKIIAGVVTDQLFLNPKSRISFKKVFEEYVLLRSDASNAIGNNLERQNYIENERPIIKKAYDLLGVDEVRRLKYHSGNIKSKLSIKADDSEGVKIYKMLSPRVELHVPIKTRDILRILQDVYDSLNLKRRAKTRDLSKWFKVKSGTKRYGEGLAKSVMLSESYIYT